jgi:hypothetical protein
VCYNFFYLYVYKSNTALPSSQWQFDTIDGQWTFQGFTNGTNNANSSLPVPQSEHTTWVVGNYIYIFGGIARGKRIIERINYMKYYVFIIKIFVYD